MRHVKLLPLALVVVASALYFGAAKPASATLPPGNTVEQWNKIAEDTIVGSGAFQNEGLIYMAYTSAAVYDAVVAVQGGYEPLGPPRTAAAGASTDAAVVEAAYRVLKEHFPTQAATLDTLHAEALAAIPSGAAKIDGQAAGAQAAADIIAMRTGDGRLTPIATTSTFATKSPGPGVWRLTPPTYAAPQTPWVASVDTFILRGADQFLPGPPPGLKSDKWVAGFKLIKRFGAATGSERSTDQTNTALFWTANVIRQYNRVARDIIDAKGLGLPQSARLAAMVNVTGADAQMSVMYAKYRYLFWRPVTAIDPTSVNPAGDGFGPVPGFDDGNSRTIEAPGWRPLIATPNHPEYPAAHGSITSAMAKVFTKFLGGPIDLDVHGFDPTGAVGNLDAVKHFADAAQLRTEIVNARLWAGVHYRFSGIAGVTLGRKVARYDLAHAFQQVG
jgi:hypothetical protein